MFLAYVQFRRILTENHAFPYSRLSIFKKKDSNGLVHYYLKTLVLHSNVQITNKIPIIFRKSIIMISIVLFKSNTMVYLLS